MAQLLNPERRLVQKKLPLRNYHQEWFFRRWLEEADPGCYVRRRMVDQYRFCDESNHADRIRDGRQFVRKSPASVLKTRVCC